MNIGIDIGGSHIGIGIVNKDGIIIKKAEHNIVISDMNNIQNVIENFIINVIKKWKKEDNLKIEKIGIGVPGVVKGETIKYSVNLGITNYNLVDILRKEFSEAEIKIKNDAKCAALAEKNIGALQQYSDCVFLCLGTGIGGAVFYNNQLIMPKRSSGFEFGHMTIAKDGELCRCGSNGCFEQYGAMKKFKTNMIKALNIQENIDGEELYNIINKNISDERVNNIINKYIQDLSVGLSNIINIIEPQAICIGGSFSYYSDLLLDRLKSELRNSNYIFYKENIPDIVIAGLKNDAGIIGSALFV